MKCNSIINHILVITVLMFQVASARVHRKTALRRKKIHYTLTRSLSSSKSPSSTKSPSRSTKSPSGSTKSPSGSTKSPSKSTKSPSSAPTKSPLPSPPECVLEATLGYPYSDPDESPHKGYNSDWLMVERGEGLNDDDYCWGGSNTDWCTVINTSGNSSMGAYIGNVDDYYADWAAEDDQVHNEIFTLRDVGAKTMWLKVNHFFLKTDYYTEFWNDHLMAAALTVTNKNNGKTLSPNGGWSYPVAPNVPTHIKNTAGKEIANPDYPHYFYVSVNCTEYCNCEAGDYEVFYGE